MSNPRGVPQKKARSGSDPFPITLPERVNDWSKVARVLLQWKRPHLYRPKSGGRPRRSLALSPREEARSVRPRILTPTQQALYDDVVTPALRKRAEEIEGKKSGVNE